MHARGKSRYCGFFAWFCVCLLTGCTPPSEPTAHEYTIIAFGTIVTVEIVSVDEQLASRARDALQASIAKLDRDWYAFGDGELGRVNAALANGSAVHTTPELAALIERSLSYRALSDGLFDPVIADLVELWGFADFDVSTGTPTPPSDAALKAWRSSRAPRRVVSVTDQSISSTDRVAIDLGGVAKGTILARAMALLEQIGIHNAMVDTGGDIMVIGSRGGRPWRIGIRSPFTDSIIGTVELNAGEAIVTSGNYERYFDHDGRRYQHILDPRTAKPVTGTAGVTIIHTDPELADAAATALMVAGAERFDEIAARMGIASALLLDSRGRMSMTPAMARRITLSIPR